MSQQGNNHQQLSCEAMDSLQFLQWEDEVDDDDSYTSENRGQEHQDGQKIVEGVGSSATISAPIHQQHQDVSNLGNFMEAYGFPFPGNIGDLPPMPNDSCGDSNSEGNTNNNNNNWGDKPLMSGVYSEASNRLNSTIASKSGSSMVARGNKRSNSGTGTSQKCKSNTSKNSTALPPFMLFDAPCELRFNFAQTQQQHNIPLQVGANDLHYGVPVNGFHPQVNAQENPPVTMLDARHCRKSKSTLSVTTSTEAPTSERNEREQKRAHKITELIEELRVSMIDGGWNVQIKSKYHTLSTCQDYVRHLIKTTKEMEEKIQRVKQDAELKNLDVGTSEAESISSFSSETSIVRKRRSIIRNINANELMNKKLKVAHEVSSSLQSNDGPIDKDQLAQSSSSVVALTDSEATVASNPVAAKEVPLMVRPESDNDKSLNDSNAWTSYNDVCYDDVFMESNLPQLIATTSGRIVSWNKALLKATGVSKQQIRHLTLFSLVKLEHLSALFSLVANALKNPAKEHNVDMTDFDSITLPCISFDSNLPNCKNLFMTVTLIVDPDPVIRCFHCVFTDCRGNSKKKMGFLSDDLFVALYEKNIT